jgi:predicted nucleic acid-binding protein
VIVILDASTLINLANGEVFATVASLPGRSFKVSDVVRQESKTVGLAIQAAIKRGDIAWVDADLIDAGQYGDALDLWGLGPGETECILAAQMLDCFVACDDGAARKVIKQKSVGVQLTGSIGLLRDAVAAGFLSSAHAFEAYELMKVRGGYLPDLKLDDF